MSHHAWTYPNPFTIEWTVNDSQIDHYNHVNNVVYVQQLETLSWAHSNALGLTIDDYQQLDRAMVIRRHTIDYLAAALKGDTLTCATWIVLCDNKLRLNRYFEFIRRSDNKTMLTATTEFICTALSSGKPSRMPSKFIDIYGSARISV